MNSNNIICIYCNSLHKFSPFNVNTIIRLNIKQPILKFNNDNMLIACIVDEFNLEKNPPITNELIKNNSYTKDNYFYWGNHKDILIGQYGLSYFLSINLNNVDENTIKSLLKYIKCVKWWNDLFLEIDKYNFKIDENNFIYNQNLLDKIISLYNIIKLSYNEDFKNYNILIKKIQELIKRYYENKADNNENIDNEIERLKLLEKQEIEENRLNYFETFESRFLSTLKKKHLGTIKFLATINPTEQILADMINKLGENSNLNKIIEELDKIKIIKFWEFYLKQQEELKNGKKFKKIKFGKKTENLDIDLDSNVLLELNNVQKIKYNNIYNLYLKEKELNIEEKRDFILDDWQNEAINYIREGHSCLIKGPTSGGKTYIMMKALDNIINNNNDYNIIVYISPTFHLAYQTFANIKATFPNRQVAIITLEIIHIPKNANIFIGTSCEILNYFNTMNKSFQIGIFDEIHVATTLYFNNSSLKEKLRARAYAKLLSKCETQIIAASATIKNIDAMKKFIISMKNLDSNNKINLEDIKVITYNKRIIPLKEYRFLENNYLKEIIRDNFNNEINIPEKNKIISNINSSNLFKLLILMKEKMMNPTIIFDNCDDNAWKTYTDLIKFCNINESKDYKSYHLMVDLCNNIINDYNTEFHKLFEMIPEKEKSKKINNTNKTDAVYRTILKKRYNTIEKLIGECKFVIKKDILNYNENNIDAISKLTNIKSNYLETICELLAINKTSLFKSFPNFFIIQSHIDMILILDQLIKLNRDVPELIMNINDSRGEYYKFANSPNINLLKNIREPGNNEEFWKQRKKMISLAEAQNIKPKDIDSIIDVIIEGLEFGLSIINPSLPFIIQNIILENLKSKEMGIVFASESMSMGINYPLRSVIIKGITGFEDVQPSKLIQMAGRCGRRGKDSQAYVIYWGIKNAENASHESIPPIIFPEHFIIDNINLISGGIISNHETMALNLGEIFTTKYFEEPNEEELKKNINLKRNIFLKPVIECISQNLGFQEDIVKELVLLICKIDDNIILDEFMKDSFEKSQKINLLVSMMIELFNYYANCSNKKFLDFLEKIVKIFQYCEYKLIKLQK